MRRPCLLPDSAHRRTGLQEPGHLLCVPLELFIFFPWLTCLALLADMTGISYEKVASVVNSVPRSSADLFSSSFAAQLPAPVLGSGVPYSVLDPHDCTRHGHPSRWSQLDLESRHVRLAKFAVPSS